jgi:eukaryotic-like serine/threonine-protein kinase
VGVEPAPSRFVCPRLQADRLDGVVNEAAASQAEDEPLIVGRYALFDALASGGMATVHLGRLLGAGEAGRTVAVKRLHAHFTTDHDFATMFMDEARIVARIRHENVVSMVDVIESETGLFIVMEYIHGEALSKLLRTCRSKGQLIPIPLAGRILHDVLLGLHAAHETKDDDGRLLQVVHRDVSPQNVMIGADGVARVLDFGVAKAAGRAQVTREGQIKGKLTYMSPEQIRGKVDRRADVFAAAVVLWEALAGRRFHDGAKDIEIVTRTVKGDFKPPSSVRTEIPPELDAVVMKGLEVDPAERWPDARAMALALERTVDLATPADLGDWVKEWAADVLKDRAEKVAVMEKRAASLSPADLKPPSDEDDDAEETVVFAREPVEHTVVMPAAKSSTNLRASTPGPIHGAMHTPSAAMVPAARPQPGSGTYAPAQAPPPFVPPQNRPMEREPTSPLLIAVLSFCIALVVVGALMLAWSAFR